MKKTILVSALTLIFVFGASNLVMAQWADNNPEPNQRSSETMLPHMQKMNPEMAEDELRQRHENCPYNNGESLGQNHRHHKMKQGMQHHGNMMR